MDMFQVLEDISHIIQEASSVLTNWRGVAGFKTMCGSVLTELFRTCVSCEFHSWPSCVVPFIYGEVIFSPQCINLSSCGSINYITLFMPGLF